MSLKLRLKESLFRILDLLPKKQGFYLYHKIQDVFNGENMLQRVRTNEPGFEVLKRLLRQNQLSIEDMKILEIGSGWAPIMPYFMLYQGKVKSVSTFDLNRHFSKKNISRLNEVFDLEYGIRVTPGTAKPYHLPKNIFYYPNTNLIDADLPETELVFSRLVLEHVKPEDLALMHKRFKRELNPESLIVHLISPSDHRAYVDKNLSLQDFLQYSEAEWQKKQTKFDYHNRLRLPQYLAIFKAAGLEVLQVEYDQPGADTYKKFRSVPLHEDFKNFTDEELTAGSINVVLKV